MPTLQKAKLKKIGARGGDAEIEVQFNPASLKIQLSNRIEGGRSQGRQVRQFIGSSSTVFNLDLEFDSADEGSTEAPVSVLEKTRFLEQFIQPKTDNGEPEEKPEKLRFSWGNLIIDGVVESIDMDFDHFAHNGYPLHAKVTLSMKEQRIEFQLKEKSASSTKSQAAQALGGELPAELASRLGFDPGAWRGLGLDLSLGLELEAGLEIGFDAGISASLGVDIQAGFEAGIDVSLAASLGLEAGASVSGTKHLQGSAGTSREVSSGVALARAGGVIRATETLKSSNAATAADDARQAFAATTVAAPTFSVSSAVSTSSAAARGLTGGGSGMAEQRSLSYGFGVPLKTQHSPLAQQRRNTLAGGALNAVDPLAMGGGLSKAPWQTLPRRDQVRAYADDIQRRRAPINRCGCTGRCRHHQQEE